MQALGAILSPIFALAGVVLGGLITSRIQRKNQETAQRLAVAQERQNACIDFLAAIRQYRRFLMYSDTKIEDVEPTSESKGTIIVEGAAEYVVRVDGALARIQILARSGKIASAAEELSSLLTKFRRLRARHGKGMIPNEEVKKLQDAERDFAALVREELGLNS